MTDSIRLKDFRPINGLSIIAILLMGGMAIFQILVKPNGWMTFMIIDSLLGLLNLGILLFSLSSHRDMRVIEEQLAKLVKKREQLIKDGHTL